MLASAATAVGQGHDVDVVTPFDVTSRGGVRVDVVINDRGPFRLLLDTGSTHSILAERVARALGAQPVAQALVDSAAGARMAPVVAIDRLVLGPIDTTLFPSVVPDLPLGGEADGLLGQDVLGPRHYTIDYGRGLLTWHGRQCAPRGSPLETVPLDAVNGRFIVDASVANRPVRLVVDSGSEALVLFGSSAAGPTAAILETASGRRRVATGRVGTLQVGTALVADVVVAYLDRGLAPGEAQGLLPLHGFGRVTINGPARTLAVEAR
jgi:predicted aspartyl protease